MADLFGAAAPAERKRPSLHSDTEIYRAVEDLGAHLLRAIANMRRDVKNIVGPELLYEASSIAELVRQQNIARDAAKVPYLDEIVGRAEKLKYLLRVANSAQFLPNNAYANSIPLTESIARQAQGLKNKFNAPASSPAT